MNRVLPALPSWSAVILATVLVLAPPTVSAQAAITPESFEGVWKVTKVVSPDGVVDLRPQPSLAIFSRGYYTIIRDNSSGPRPEATAPKDSTKLTDPEKLALYQEWSSIGAQGGTYEMQGDTLVTRADVAKMVRGVGLVERAVIKFDGQTFTAQPKPGEPNAGRVTTYTRVR